ncbi:hypothetical protein Tco_1229710 [Tanacetum coccineum]
MASTRASISKASKRPKINIILPKQLFVDLTHDDFKTPSPKHQLSSPSAPNAPSKTPSTKDQYAVSIKEDMAYPCLHSPKTTKGMKLNTPYPDDSIRRNKDMESIYYSGRYQTWSLLQEIPNTSYPIHGYVIRVDDDLHNLSSVEAEFPSIVINDAVAPQDELQCKSQVSTPVNDEIDFRISFDESDDEDYTILFDKNSFSYKMIYVNDLKTDSENDYEKVMPSIPSPKLAISCFDDLDFFTDFENEFLVIVYNDAQMSKSDLLSEPILNPQQIDEFDLNDKTTLSKYNEEEQNVLYFNDLFPFNIIRPNNLKSEKYNDDSKIDIILSFEDNEYTHGSTMVFETSHDKNTKNFITGNFVINLNLRIVIWIHYANGMLFFLIKNLCAPFGIPFDPKRYYKDGVCLKMLRRPRTECLNFYTLVLSSIDFADMALPPREQRHRFLRNEGLEYPDTDIVNFKGRLARIHRREVHRVPVFDFGGLPDLMAEGLSGRMLMEHRDEAGVSVFTSRAWRRMFDIRGPLVHELILEFFSTFRFGQAILDLDTPGTLQFQLGRARRRMSWRQFILALGLHTEEEMQTAGFGVYWAESARQIPDKGDLRDYWMGISSAGDFLGTAPSYTLIRDPILRLCHRLIACSIAGRSQAPEKVTVTDLFYLRGMDVDSVNIPYLLARYLRLFAAGRKSGAHISCGQFIYAQFDDTWAWVAMGPERQPDAAAGAPDDAEDAPIIDEGGQADPASVLGRLEEDVQGLHRDVGSLRVHVERSTTDQGRFSTWMMTCMTQLMDASGLTYQAFDGTFRGSSPAAFERRTKQRTGVAQ